MSAEIVSALRLTEGEFLAQAVYSDETRSFRSPEEPLSTDEVEITLRVGRDTCSAVFLCTQEREYLMEEKEACGCFAYYHVVLPPEEGETLYYFRLQHRLQIGYYTMYGYQQTLPEDGRFRLIRGYQTPDWAKGAIMYQIFPDRFCNGDRSNDVKTGEYRYLERQVVQVSDWERLPEATDINHFYGGDLQGVLERLDYLEDLGVEVLYFNPLFVSPSNHKYDTQDYEHIDPHFGVLVRDGGAVLPMDAADNQQATLYRNRTTKKENLEASDRLFAKLVAEAHRRGMRVILDGVFNHCGAFHKWMDREGFYCGRVKGAYQEKESPFHDYFYWNEDGSYEGWWGYENHPKLNLEGCEALRQEILEIGKRWVSPPFCADGWRLDVAADLGKTPAFNHAFWRMFRQAVKGVSTEKLILAEHYGEAAAWLQGDQWDSVMNYDAFMEPVTWFFTGVSKHSTEERQELYNHTKVFWETMEEQRRKLPPQAVATAMNELSNHDHSRFLTRTNRRLGRLETAGSLAAGQDVDLAVLREAVLLQMTWSGAPTIYYGDEAGLVGWTDPDNRRTYPWGKEDQALIAFHRAAIRLRKEHPCLRHGAMLCLSEEEGVIAYGRFEKEEALVVAINNTEKSKNLSLPVWKIGMQPEGALENLLLTDGKGFTTFGVQYPIRAGRAELTLPPKSGIVLKEVKQ